MRIRELQAWLRHEPVGAALLSLAGDSSVYLAGGLLIGLGNVVLVPLYTRSLLPRDFGVYALIDVTILLIVTATALKLDVSYLKWFADLDPSRHGELFGSAFLASLAAATLGGLALSLAVGGRAGEMWLHDPARQYTWLLLPVVVLENLQALFLTDLRARRRAVAYSATAIVRLTVLVIASYYLLAVQQMGLYGLFLGRLIGDTISFVFVSIIGIRSFVLTASLPLLRPMLRFGVPLIWGVFAVMCQDAAGRYFLSRYASLEQVGLLGAAIKIGAVFQMLIGGPFGVAWGGVLFQIGKAPDGHVIYSKIFAYVYVLALGVALVLTIFSPTLFRIFTASAYYPAAAVLPLVLVVRALTVIEQPSATGIYLTGRTHLFALNYTVALAVNLVLLRVLVPRYGLMGVGWSWLAGSAVVPVLNLFFGQKLYPLVFHAKLIVLPLLPWIFVFLRWPTEARALISAHFLVQCALSAAVLVGLGGLLFYDIRNGHRQFQNRGAVAPAWEMPSR